MVKKGVDNFLNIRRLNGCLGSSNCLHNQGKRTTVLSQRAESPYHQFHAILRYMRFLHSILSLVHTLQCFHSFKSFVVITIPYTVTICVENFNCFYHNVTSKETKFDIYRRIVKGTANINKKYFCTWLIIPLFYLFMFDVLYFFYIGERVNKKCNFCAKLLINNKNN